MIENLIPERVPTRVPGLDLLLEGGFLAAGVYIAQGPPGAGKTILANQIAYAHAAAGGQVVYVTLLAEQHSRMLGHLARFHFFDPAAVAHGVYYLAGWKTLEAEGMEGLFRLVRAAITDRKASFLVIDGLVSAEDTAASREFKKLVHGLQSLGDLSRCTTLLLGSTERPRSVHPVYTMVDGILELSDQISRRRTLRHIEVRKFRGADQITGQHTFDISEEGIRIHPRIETQLGARPTGIITPGGGRAAFGLLALDAMLKGGLPTHSVTMLLGPSGSGKTLLGLQFLAEGVRQGEPCVYFGFYERPESLMRKGDRIGLPIRPAVDKGILDLVWRAPVEGRLDVIGSELLDVLRRKRAKRLCLDGVHGFESAADYPERIPEVFSALAEELEADGVTTVFTMETPDIMGARIQPSIPGLSRVTQNILLTRWMELHSRLHRVLSVLKVRDSDFDPTIRELAITDAGLTLGDSFEGTARVLAGAAHDHPATAR